MKVMVEVKEDSGGFRGMSFMKELMIIMDKDMELGN